MLSSEPGRAAQGARRTNRVSACNPAAARGCHPAPHQWRWP